MVAIFKFILTLTITCTFLIGCKTGIKVDPIDNDPKYSILLEEVDNLIKSSAEYKQYKFSPGKCHIYWKLKKKVLKDVYNIDWKSPAELNPGVYFD